ncbi:hypothetical protein [Actinophytocola sp.]|uniref:hypothetical protein n=1 Tax=Actinophytocola sp. TaxID=1872138 RepID=UPI00389ACC33
MSYRDSGGAVVGLAVAAHRDDEHAQRVAEASVTAWAAVMRTRRVLLESTGPSCAGLRHEAALIARAGGPVAVLASDTASRDVSSRWPWRGVRLVARLVDLPPGATVVLPAHGTTATAPELRAATARGVRVIDATCPLVARAQATAQRFAAEQVKVVVVAGNKDAAAPSLAARAPDSTVVTSTADIDALTVDTTKYVAYVVSPGLPAEDAGALATQLRQRFPGTIGQHPDELCYAASDRRAAIRAVASNTELTLVLGTADSIDTQILTTTAAATNAHVERVGTPTDLRPEWLAQTTSIGILASASAPPALAGELLEVLSGLGPLSIAKRTVTTTVEHAVTSPARTRRAG